MRITVKSSKINNNIPQYSFIIVIQPVMTEQGEIGGVHHLSSIKTTYHLLYWPLLVW